MIFDRQQSSASCSDVLSIQSWQGKSVYDGHAEIVTCEVAMKLLRERDDKIEKDPGNGFGPHASVMSTTI